MTYAEALARIEREIGAPLAGHPAREAAALANFEAFFASFVPDKVERLLDRTYAPGVWFNDTLKTIEGREALGPYLKHSASAVDDCRVTIDDRLGNGRGDWYVRWRMMIRFKRFARGQDTWSIGMSHLRFDAEGLIVLHQDYWNAADAFYAHLPLVGAAIRAIKRRV